MAKQTPQRIFLVHSGEDEMGFLVRADNLKMAKQAVRDHLAQWNTPDQLKEVMAETTIKELEFTGAFSVGFETSGFLDGDEDQED